MCQRHYNSLGKWGDPTRVDDTLEDYIGQSSVRVGDCLVWTEAVSADGYGRFRHNGKNVYAHRAAYGLAHPDEPLPPTLDHTCHNRRCVDVNHLRPVTTKENTRSLIGATSRSQSGVRGVSWEAVRGKWQASVQSEGKNHSRRFTDLHEAEEWVKVKREELFGEYAGGS